jgi:hypothetical protein
MPLVRGVTSSILQYRHPTNHSYMTRIFHSVHYTVLPFFLLPFGATSQGEVWPPEQSASI